MQYAEQLLERFLTYVGFDTQSKPTVKHSPSSIGQLKLAEYLAQELRAFGLSEVEINSHGILTALLPSNVKHAPTIGLISHLDTSPDCSGKNVRPEVIENYRGGDIALGSGEEDISPVDFPFLHQFIGKTLIVTDGTTLLGADNKAGIAEIMTALFILRQSEKPRCNLRIAFTPDEEIGLGMQFFPLDKFPCDWAYTIDGGEVGELEYENFNAASATVTIHGCNIHPGTAKNKMVNALTLACDFQQSFPRDETPETTDGKQGFYHLNSFSGNVEKAELHYLIRDFEQQGFEKRKNFITNTVAEFNRSKHLKVPIELTITDSYHNMYDCVKKVPQAIKLADAAKPIRGGTDGAWLAEKGIACPNIFTGGYNFHSKKELITLEGMQNAVEVIVKIAELAVKK